MGYEPKTLSAVDSGKATAQSPRPTMYSTITIPSSSLLLTHRSSYKEYVQEGIKKIYIYLNRLFNDFLD